MSTRAAARSRSPSGRRCARGSRRDGADRRSSRSQRVRRRHHPRMRDGRAGASTATSRIRGGLIDNLPDGCCVEVPCLVGAQRHAAAARSARCPRHLAALMQTNVNVQELMVEAALTGKREDIYHAAMLDPHTAAELPLDEIWRARRRPARSPRRDDPGRGGLRREGSSVGGPQCRGEEEVVMTTDEAVRAPRAPGPADVQPVAHETLDRTLVALMTVGADARARRRGLAVVGRAAAARPTWRCSRSLYVLTGLGVTVGFHRLFTHRSFKTRPARARRRWPSSARPRSRARSSRGSPTTASTTRSPTSRATRTARTSTTASACGGALRGLLHAHIGWLFVHDQRGARDRYAPDLLADPVDALRPPVRSRCGRSAASPLAFVLGFAIGGSVEAGLTGLLWGGGVRLFVLHHVTYSINSICHVFGRRRFATGGRVAQRALAVAVLVRRVLAQQPPRVPDLGAARAGPLGARPVGAVIRGLAATGLAWDVVGVSPRAPGAQARARRGG